MPPAARIRPYKDFITPALHRRFTRGAAVLLILCYVESVLIGQWNSCSLLPHFPHIDRVLTLLKYCGHGSPSDEQAYVPAYSLFAPFRYSSSEYHSSMLVSEQQPQPSRLSNNMHYECRPYRQLAGTSSLLGCTVRSTFSRRRPT
jgi:hypothetical protein